MDVKVRSALHRGYSRKNDGYPVVHLSSSLIDEALKATQRTKNEAKQRGSFLLDSCLCCCCYSLLLSVIVLISRGPRVWSWRRPIWALPANGRNGIISRAVLYSSGTERSLTHSLTGFRVSLLVQKERRSAKRRTLRGTLD